MISPTTLLVAAVCLLLRTAGVLSSTVPVRAPKQVVFKEGTIPFFDVHIAYKLFDITDPGEDEAGRQNPTAIFLHGAKYASDFWMQLGTLKLVAESGVRALAIDLPGFGRTPELPYSDNNMRAELIKTVVEFAWPRVNSTIILVSPSMSGRYSIPFLDRHGVMITSFVAVASIGIKDWGGPWEDTHKRVCALAVYGDKDVLLPDADRVLRLFANSFKVVIPGAGHRSYEDKPALFHKALLPFLRKCRRTPDGGHQVHSEEGIELVRALKAVERGEAR